MWRYILIGIFACIVSRASANCADDQALLTGSWGQAIFQVEVARTPAERAKGLMFRKFLPRFNGMLFVHPDESERAFWMKNTLIPLDILYFDRSGGLVSISKNAIPGDLTSLYSRGAAMFVLEINAGLSDDLGIQAETQLTWPICK